MKCAKKGSRNSINLYKQQVGELSRYLFLAVFLLSFSSCKEDEEPRSLVSTQDREFATQASYSNLAEIAWVSWHFLMGTIPPSGNLPR